MIPCPVWDVSGLHRVCVEPPPPYVWPARALPARAKSLYIPPSLWAMHGPTPTVIVCGVKV